VAVLVEHGGHGGSAAAPVAKIVVEKYLSLKVQPPRQLEVNREGEMRAG
jgi:cell division protein FtsI/penicillin-binding protein 2